MKKIIKCVVKNNTVITHNVITHNVITHCVVDNNVKTKKEIIDEINNGIIYTTTKNINVRVVNNSYLRTDDNNILKDNLSEIECKTQDYGKIKHIKIGEDENGIDIYEGIFIN